MSSTIADLLQENEILRSANFEIGKTNEKLKES